MKTPLFFVYSIRLFINKNTTIYTVLLFFLLISLSFYCVVRNANRRISFRSFIRKTCIQGALRKTVDYQHCLLLSYRYSRRIPAPPMAILGNGGWRRFVPREHSSDVPFLFHEDYSPRNVGRILRLVRYFRKIRRNCRHRAYFPAFHLLPLVGRHVV